MLKFKKHEPTQVRDAVKIAEEARQASDNAVAAAQSLLQSPGCERYRQQYLALREKLWAELEYIDEEEHDPVRYGFRVKDIVAKLRHTGALLRAITAEASRKA